jgi:hypothetical protein
VQHVHQVGGAELSRSTGSFHLLGQSDRLALLRNGPGHDGCVLVKTCSR